MTAAGAHRHAIPVEHADRWWCGDRLLLEHVEKDADLQEQLGTPVRIGKWYNAAIGVRCV